MSRRLAPVVRRPRGRRWELAPLARGARSPAAALSAGTVDRTGGVGPRRSHRPRLALAAP